MTFSIGLAGKGGTGKTTIAGMLVKYLVDKGRAPVLAVDADSNSNLNEVLGLKVEETLGDAREEMKNGVASGMTKDVFMEMKLSQAVVETDGFDLIVMGRPEGSGCYCAANTLLTQYLDRLIKNYTYVVIDNEAGMEHMSRLTTNNIDLLLIVSDASRRSILSASRVSELADDLALNIERKVFIINQAKDGQEAFLKKTAEEYNLELAGIIHEDSLLSEFDLQGRPTIELGLEDQALSEAYKFFDKIFDQ
ncbi:MAG: AAA family ATPase [Deltaproteobacteria bacterium]|nr:AAA family ATPase [Deltaproteobacteria bacterium]MBW1915746.1 AAA family ATPase [Deltaproteobacteria bacterium]